MTSLMKKLMLATAVVAAPMMIATTASAEGEKYILVSHAPDSDSWWNTVKNGIALAGEQMDVEVEYRNPPTGDLADMARIIEQAAASNPNGTISSSFSFTMKDVPPIMADAFARYEALFKPNQAGIPPKSTAPKRSASVSELMVVVTDAPGIPQMLP